MQNWRQKSCAMYAPFTFYLPSSIFLNPAVASPAFQKINQLPFGLYFMLNIFYWLHSQLQHFQLRPLFRRVLAQLYEISLPQTMEWWFWDTSHCILDTPPLTWQINCLFVATICGNFVICGGWHHSFGQGWKFCVSVSLGLHIYPGY